MATFEVQIEGLTGLDITTTTQPTQDELTQFLKDGIIDVQNRHLSVKPSDVHLFSKESPEAVTNGLNVSGSQIISVVREAGVDEDWRECRFIPPSIQSRVTDIDSFYFASKYNPAYTILGDNNISVFPTPGDTGADAYKVHHVNNDPVIIDYASSTIGSFPANKVYLVAIYAGIQVLAHKMTALITHLPVKSTSAQGTAGSSGWLYVEYLVNTAEDIELGGASSAALGAEVQQYIVEYQWYGERMKLLKAQYDEAFQLDMPKPAPQPQQQQRGR